jgi:predicted enzyme involved in methoxymalonyl-ACP biosynthesis
MVLRELVQHARARGVRRLVGVYIPTERNAMVGDHYAKLAFRQVAADESGRTTWELDTDVEIEAAPMEVDRSGFVLSPA